MTKTALRILVYLVAASALYGCRGDDVIYVPVEKPTGDPDPTSPLAGFYLLNEGNMGSNKCTLDYYDYGSATYALNIYADANPDVPMELGDVGNDLKIYGSRLYAVVNCSNKVEVMHATTARRIGQVDIPNCRSIAFDGPYAYVTSYAGPVEITPDYSQIGYVAKVDTATLQVVDRCLVGYQPNELAIADGKIYVANSGGYMVPNYENTVSVIDLETFKPLGTIEFAINLQLCRYDNHGHLWVSSRGDYYDDPGQLFCYNTQAQRIERVYDIAPSSIAIDGDSLYYIASQFSYVTMQSQVSYGIIDTATLATVSSNFIADGTDASISKPYGLAVNPYTKDIYVTDARNYINPGTLYCFSHEGIKKWSVRTGDIPAHFAFLKK